MEGVVDAYPLSELQQGMYFHSELAPHSAVYHDVSSLRVELRFDEECFQRALASLVQRHAVLRTTFATSVDHRLLQLVHQSISKYCRRVRDLSALSSCGARGQSIHACLEQEKQERFIWSQPLWRMYVHVLAPGRFQLTLGFHHAILDGWSLASLNTELLRDYSRLLEGQDLSSEEPLALYRDYIAREQQALQSAQTQQYWRALLEDASFKSVPTMPADETLEKGREVARHEVMFAAELSRDLDRCARRLGVGLRSLLLAAHIKVMSVVCAERDVVTGVVSHGRVEEEGGDRALGLHLNSLPLRVRLPEGSWRELVQQVREVEEGMWPHRRYPLAAIGRLTGRGELFDTLFNFVRFHVVRQVSETGLVSGGELFEQTNFALVVNFGQALRGPQFQLSISFDPAVHSRPQVERLGGYYAQALQRMAADIDSRPRCRKSSWRSGAGAGS